MKRFLLLLSAVMLFGAADAAGAGNVYRDFTVGPFRAGHVQGVAVDRSRGHIYFSFTTMLVKTDLSGNVLATVEGLIGHLGCLAFNEQDGLLYGSLEYKNDAIGRGILKAQGVDGQVSDRFYIAVFDPALITRQGMNAERDGVMTAVNLPTVLDDYTAMVQLPDGEYEHRFGCSGIDGVSFGPAFGRSTGRNFLVVAYGIYGDTARTDNDCQVLLQYDVRNWDRFKRPLSQNDMHTSGPVRPKGVYFVRTGNTTYGVQNLEYDSCGQRWFMAAYRGKKSQFPNYTLFAVDGRQKAARGELQGVPYMRRGRLLPLEAGGLSDSRSGISGWNFDATTGLCSLGDNLFFVVRPEKSPEGQSAHLMLMRFTGAADSPFVPAGR